MFERIVRIACIQKASFSLLVRDLCRLHFNFIFNYLNNKIAHLDELFYAKQETLS